MHSNSLAVKLKHPISFSKTAHFLLIIGCSLLSISHAWNVPRVPRNSVKAPVLLSCSLSSSATTKEVPDKPPKTPNNLVRYRGRVSYDGSSFQGFQIQLGTNREAITIQGTLEQVLQRRFRRESIRVVGAGRTDSGVNARGQAFHFDLTNEEHESLQELKHNKPLPPLDVVMNKMLQDEGIQVFHVGVAPRQEKIIMFDKDEDNNNNNTNSVIMQTNSTATRTFAWNAIHDSTHKLYSYYICVAPVMDPIYRFRRWQVPGDNKLVNITKLAQALALYEGTHDFRAFAGSVEQIERKAQRKVNSVRTIYQCRLVDESDGDVQRGPGREGFYRIDFVLSGALYKMVRNLVGTAIGFSRGALDESTFQELIQDGNITADDEDDQQQPQLTRKDNPCKPAPPEGLTLEWVFYDDDNEDNGQF